MDGGAVVWRVTAKVVSPQQPVASNLTVAPTMNVDVEEGISELPLVMPQRFAPFMRDLENAREEVRASLVLHQHHMEQNQGVFSLGVEFENRSMTHYARIEFNPMDPNLELFDAQDRAVPEGPKVITEPVPQTQVAIIPPSSYVVFSTRDPDIGLNGEEYRLGAGGQVWNLVSGTYRLRGMIPVTVQFVKSRFDESRRETALPPDSWPAAVDKVNLPIHLSTFTVP